MAFSMASREFSGASRQAPRWAATNTVRSSGSSRREITVDGGTEFYPQDGCEGWKDSIEKFGGLKVLKTLLPITKSTHYVPFESIEMPVMDCAMDFVVDYYGPGWRVPDPTFVYPRKGETNYEECPDKLGVISK